jgi:ureidoacrylate peracid hydrolase
MLEIPMFSGQVPTKDTALLVIDMQKAFMDNALSMGQSGTDIEPLRAAIDGSVRAVAAAREANVPVIFTRFVYTKNMRDFPVHRRDRNARRIELLSLGEDQDEIGILPELTPRPDEIVIDKSRPSSFYGTRLEPILTSAGIRNLVVCGVTTSICVETTVRDAGQRDYWTFVLRDAVAEIDPGRNHYALFNMSWSFAEITETETLKSSWAGR